MSVIPPASAEVITLLSLFNEKVLVIKTERDRYEAALRKIAGWKGYSPPADPSDEYVPIEYEKGANEMLETLKQMAEEALS